MKLKICGISDATFACAAAARGVDYLGFIFHARSPRAVDSSQASEIVRRVKAEKTEKRPRLVGVFVGQTQEEIVEIMREVGLDIVQLHRRASEDDVAKLKAAGYEVWTLAGGAVGDGLLFDSSHGDGDTAFRRGSYLSILAGGIGVANLAEAVAYGSDVLDVNSSLETTPGKKSLRLLDEFLIAFGRA